MPPYTVDTPAKKQSKWSAEEDALIIELRGSGMKWEDISKRLPGRSAISCRLHYQNYLERRSEWDEERKNKLARLYERFKPEMWARVAEEMQVPWRAAEAMHWQLGEAEMARRAGVTPFSLSAMAIDSSSAHHRQTPSRAPFTQSLQSSSRYGLGGSVQHSLPPPPPHLPMSMAMPMQIPEDRPFEGGGFRGHGGPGARSAGPMSSYQPPPPPPPPPLPHQQQQQQQQQRHYRPAELGLPPIQTSSPYQQQERASGSSGTLPSLSEITTGVTSYSTAAFDFGSTVTMGGQISLYAEFGLEPELGTGPGPVPQSGYGLPAAAAGPSSAHRPPGLAYPPMQVGGGSEAAGPAGASGTAGAPGPAGAPGGSKRRASPNFELREAHKRQF